MYLFSGDDYKTQADITDTNVGQNYINAQSEKSDAAFTLANDSAQSGGYYFKRVDDKKTFETLSYDMWQVAKDPTLTLRPEDQTIYSGGKSGDAANPEFPHPIYVDRNGIPLDDDVTFKVDGAGGTIPPTSTPSPSSITIRTVPRLRMTSATATLPPGSCR